MFRVCKLVYRGNVTQGVKWARANWAQWSLYIWNEQKTSLIPRHLCSFTQSGHAFTSVPCVSSQSFKGSVLTCWARWDEMATGNGPWGDGDGEGWGWEGGGREGKTGGGEGELERGQRLAGWCSFTTQGRGDWRGGGGRRGEDGEARGGEGEPGRGTRVG